MAVRKTISGKDLQRSVIDYATMKGWKCAHFPSVETKQGWRTAVAAEAKGFPDVFLVRERAIAIEIKGDGDSLKDEQRVWGERMQRAGIEWYVVTKKEWLDGTIMEILA